MENNFIASSGNIYTKETVTINGKTFNFKRDKLSTELTKVLCKLKPTQQMTLNQKV